MTANVGALGFTRPLIAADLPMQLHMDVFQVLWLWYMSKSANFPDSGAVTCLKGTHRLHIIIRLLIIQSASLR